MPKVKLAPSILSADFSKINEEIKEVEKYSDLIHVDIMDGIFVPPTTVDSNFVKTIKTKVPLDVHLMVHEPGNSYIKAFIDAGASSITIHAEACKDPMQQIDFIKKNKIKACISIKPKTPLEKIKKYLDKVDMVLIMTVEPGWAGQKFIDEAIPKIKQLRKLKPQLDIEVDGGINQYTIRDAFDAGANVFVAGSYIFSKKDREEAIKELLNSTTTIFTKQQPEPDKTTKKYTVTPWEVTGEIDYDKLIKEFGVRPLDDEILGRLQKHTKELHYFLKRKIFFAHTYLDAILEQVEKGHKIYLYTGRAPSGPVHLGHLVPWMFCKWLQDKFDATLLFQIPDEEKFLFKDNLTLEETKKWAYDNILDIIALGFDPKKTKIFLDTEYAKTMYRHACRVSKKITFSTIKSTFGFSDSNNLGEIFYTSMQTVPAFLPSIMENKPTHCLIPCAIDQQPHFFMTNDVAPKLGYPKTATILCRFLPGLQGLDKEGKMSSSIESTTIFTTDAPEQVKKKIMKYAFSGGRDTIEEHRKKGGNPDIDTSYIYLTYFMEDQHKLQAIYNDYKGGKMLTGELKQITAEHLNKFLKEHQAKREKAKDVVEKFMLRD